MGKERMSEKYYDMEYYARVGGLNSFEVPLEEQLMATLKA